MKKMLVSSLLIALTLGTALTAQARTGMACSIAEGGIIEKSKLDCGSLGKLTISEIYKKGFNVVAISTTSYTTGHYNANGNWIPKNHHYTTVIIEK